VEEGRGGRREGGRRGGRGKGKEEGILICSPLANQQRKKK
jgi:hypothetical protein